MCFFFIVVLTSLSVSLVNASTYLLPTARYIACTCSLQVYRYASITRDIWQASEPEDFDSLFHSLAELGPDTTGSVAVPMHTANYLYTVHYVYGRVTSVCPHVYTHMVLLGVDGVHLSHW